MGAKDPLRSLGPRSGGETRRGADILAQGVRAVARQLVLESQVMRAGQKAWWQLSKRHLEAVNGLRCPGKRRATWRTGRGRRPRSSSPESRRVGHCSLAQGRRGRSRRLPAGRCHRRGALSAGPISARHPRTAEQGDEGGLSSRHGGSGG